MDNTALNASDFLSPLAFTHKSNELERAMAGFFTAVVQERQIDQLNDIYSYGVPWLGSPTVVERFTKLNGLAVLRRNDGGLSDKLMSVIYANWESIASERGLAFLQFVLDMLYPNQNQIVRLWHSMAQASRYPLYLSESQSVDKFLTSRIRIKIDSSIDLIELSELAPTLSRLVPWQVVPEVAVSIDTEDMGVQVALAGEMFHVANFSLY